MMRAWNDIDGKQERPSPKEVARSWKRLRWESLDVSSPALNRYLEALGATLTNGGYLIGRWKAVEYSETTHWFMSRNRLDEYDLFRALFSSRAFRRSLPKLAVPRGLAPGSLGLVEQWAGSLTLDGSWAGHLVSGGAYEAFEGSALEAKTLATAATRALMGDRFEDFRVDVSNDAWTPWFADVAWDTTYVLTDMRNAELVVLCMTDTD